MTRRLSTGLQLSVASTATLTLGAAWLSMSHYHAYWATRAVGAGAVIFLTCGLYLWWKWRHESEVHMGSWRDKYRRRKREIPPAAPGTAVAIGNQRSGERGPKLRFFGTKFHDNDTVFSVPDEHRSEIDVHGGEMRRNKKILEVRGRDDETGMK